MELPKLESRLTQWIEDSSKNWTNNARVIANSWLKGGLQDRCITRDLKWGTKVPLKGMPIIAVFLFRVQAGMYVNKGEFTFSNSTLIFF